ncbi:MAG TPA: hypothetical protein VGQ92_22470 [Actinoplanes sp.]|jgi:hypothetical protein|nr:hypothetical protein [Actinoplanes sp.]
MAFTLTDAFISINGVTLSDQGNHVTIEDMREEKDATAFGASNKVTAKGLGDGTITIGFFQNFAAGKVHATLQPLIGSQTPVTVEIRATSGARSATNPGIVMSALLFSYNPLDGDVGEMSVMTAIFRNASQTGITYPTS